MDSDRGCLVRRAGWIVPERDRLPAFRGSGNDQPDRSCRHTFFALSVHESCSTTNYGNSQRASVEPTSSSFKPAIDDECRKRQENLADPTIGVPGHPLIGRLWTRES